MAVFARVAKLGSGAYGARHAGVRSSVMQCVLAVRELTNSGYKAEQEQVKYRGTRPFEFPPPFPPLALIHTPLSQNGRGRAASTLNTHRQASLIVSRNTSLVPPLRSCIGPAREAGLSMVREEGTYHLVKKGKERQGSISRLNNRDNRAAGRY